MLRKDEIISMNGQGRTAEESCKRGWKGNGWAARVVTLEATALLKDSLSAVEKQYCLIALQRVNNIVFQSLF